VIGVFDCCREHYVKAVKGSGEGDDVIDMSDDGENTILIFGTRPGGGVDAVSKVAAAFIQMLNNSIQADGAIIIPNDQFN